MSDDEFSDFSDDQPTIIIKKEEVQDLSIVDEIVEKKVDNDIVENKVIQEEIKEIVDEKEKKSLNEEELNQKITYPLQWNDYKKIENDILKSILVLNWVEETFVIRASLKYIYEKEEKYQYTSQSYDLKKYKQPTDDFLPKLSLVYMVFNILEKCPFDELFECKSMLYISKMFKKSPKDLLIYFSQKLDSNSLLEKCLAYYSLIFIDHPSNRNMEHFVGLETNKKLLETMLL
jgi:hypothetical protein